MVYGYIRVSSDKQTVENQRFEINNFCQREGLHIDGWIEETISGTKAYSKRALGGLLKRVAKGDLIICAELSRLGRSLFMVMEILNICMRRECRVWTIKDNYRLGDDIQSKVLAFAFALSAEIERNLIAQRTREALARKRGRGRGARPPEGAQDRAREAPAPRPGGQDPPAGRARALQPRHRPPAESRPRHREPIHPRPRHPHPAESQPHTLIAARRAASPCGEAFFLETAAGP